MSVEDFTILGDAPPPRLGAAFYMIAANMHEHFESRGAFIPEISKRSCIMCSLICRDFLQHIGFTTARVAPVMFTVRALDMNGIELHSLGVGNQDESKFNDRSLGGWWGHMVCIVDGWLIDTTLFQAKRKQWPKLPAMMAASLERSDDPVAFGMHALAAFKYFDGAGNTIQIQWLDQPNNRAWRAAPDTNRARRWPTVMHLTDEFNRALAEADALGQEVS